MVLLGEATGLELGGLPDGVELRRDARGTKPFDLVLFMCSAEAKMTSRAPRLAERLTTAGMLWLGWPKKSSGVQTSLSDGRVREIGLGLGLVDNKTCAIDEIWSGLRFVRRVRDRSST